MTDSGSLSFYANYNYPPEVITPSWTRQSTTAPQTYLPTVYPGIENNQPFVVILAKFLARCVRVGSRLLGLDTSAIPRTSLIPEKPILLRNERALIPSASCLKFPSLSASPASMRIATLQFAPKLGDVQGNIERANALLKSGKTLASDGEQLEIEIDLLRPDILVLPELALTGTYFKLSSQHIAPTRAALLCFLVHGPNSGNCFTRSRIYRL